MMQGIGFNYQAAGNIAAKSYSASKCSFTGGSSYPPPSNKAQEIADEVMLRLFEAHNIGSERTLITSALINVADEMGISGKNSERVSQILGDYHIGNLIRRIREAAEYLSK